MANLSTAFGDVTITSADPDTLIKIVHAYKKSQEGSWYPTTLEPFDEDDIKFNEGSYHITIEFSGIGRWAYTNNIDWTIDRILETDPDLGQKPIRMLFNVSDEESVSELLYTATIETSYDPETGKVKIDQLEYTDDEYNAANLIEYGIGNSSQVSITN